VVSTVTVGTWNILAAPWCAPEFYPAEMDMTLLAREPRADRVAARLAALDADVWCLQEVTPTDLARILGGEVGRRYDHHHVGNGRELWANWSTPEVPWEPNGTAVLWKHSEFAPDHRGSAVLSPDGNVATWVGLTHRHGVQWRVMSAHLDADDPTIRRAQMPAALAGFAPAPGIVDVVAGDCNEDTAAATELGARVTAAGFVDAPELVDCLAPTHPYARPGDGWVALARIDHVLVRGGAVGSARVEDTGVWEIETPGERMAEHLRRTGSDHLPVLVELTT